MEVTTSSNQLVQACDLYLSIDYVKVALECLAWFMYKVTLPFLNVCELEPPKKMLSILLQNDLSKCKMDSLRKYGVDYSFQVHQPESPLGLYITEQFCKQEASDLAGQHGQEHGFVDIDEKEQRATDLTKVDYDIIDKLLGNHFDCEHG